jgi:hypothetical protein
MKNWEICGSPANRPLRLPIAPLMQESPLTPNLTPLPKGLARTLL